MQQQQQNVFQVSDLVDMLRRRKVQFILPIIIISALAAALAFGLPPVYRSTATILVEQQEIPSDLVRSTVTSYAAERIQSLRQRIMTRSTLWEIVEKYDLFPEERQIEDQRDNIIMKMRENISVEMLSADIIDPQSGRESRATIAFELSFDSSDPESAQAVANELASLYLSENRKLRTEKAETTSVFLAEEAERLKNQISDYEARLAAFKEKNIGQMPELAQMNMTLLERSDRELEEVESQLASLEERKTFLQSQLIHVEPNTGTSPAARLRDLQGEYLVAKAQYSENHPRIAALQREIEILEQEVGVVDDSAAVAKQVSEIRAELAEAHQKYSPDHPTVVKLEKSLASLEASLQESGSAGVALPPDNPAYISLQTQLKTIDVNMDALREKRDRVRQRLSEYENRLVHIPSVEQELLAIRRGYDSATAQYADVTQKLMQAEIAEQLERESKGERFSLIDPPQLPNQPVEPNRIGIFLLGVVFSFGGGLGYATLAEFSDKTVRGARSIIGVLKEPPLAVIPSFGPGGGGAISEPQRNSWAMIILSVLTLLLVVALIYNMMAVPPIESGAAGGSGG